MLDVAAAEETDDASQAVTLSLDEQKSIVQLAQKARAQEPETVDVTLDLTGGDISGLAADGWERATQDGTWSRTCDNGAELSLDAPVRYGYDFLGWDTDGDGSVNEGDLTASDGLTVTAVWQRQAMQVKFVSGSSSQVASVPYESILWSDEAHKPWESAQFDASETATVDGITYAGDTFNNVRVQRHAFEEGFAGQGPSGYWYSFELSLDDGVSQAFFAYGGTPSFQTASDTFSHWKMTQGGEGCQVTQDGTVFRALFVSQAAYVVNIHYRQADGTTVTDSVTKVIPQADVTSGSMTVDFNIPASAHYAVQQDGIHAYHMDGSEISSTDGFTVSVGQDNSSAHATFELGKVFPGDDGAQIKYLSIVVLYTSIQVNYQVEYYQQNAARSGYVKQETVHSTVQVSYGQHITIDAKSYDGFMVAAQSRLALVDGVYLLEQDEGNSAIVWNGTTNTFTIKIYYDRASYFIYPFANSNETAADPVRVVYGNTTPTLDNITPTKTGYSFKGWTVYRLNAVGELEPEQNFTLGSSAMPAYDLYAVAEWEPVDVSFRVVLWLEQADSPSFSNVYEKEVTLTGVKSEDKLTVNTAGDALTVSSGGSGQAQTFSSKSLLEEYVKRAYADQTDFDAEQYAQFFTYDQVDTRTSAGNVALAKLAGSIGENDSQVDETFQAVVQADGTTSINVYYQRNMYSVDIVLGKYNGQQLQVATYTPGSIGASTWQNYSGSISGMQFDGLTQFDNISAAGWQNTPTTYGLADEDGTRIERSPLGRFGTKQIDGHTCLVYQVTAKFEAPVDQFWPTLSRVQVKSNGDNKSYISLGPDEQSYYRLVTSKVSGNSNILNIYGSMNEEVLLRKSNGFYAAQSTGENGASVTHTMVSYWYENANTYTYYFLREVLDASLSPANYAEFDAQKADNGQYRSGDILKYDGALYVYDTTGEGRQQQKSTNTVGGQNAPALRGFETVGTEFTGNKDDKRDANIYFFYKRNRYDVTLANAAATGQGSDYVLPESAWKQRIDGKTLAQHGWERQSDGSIKARYGASLHPLANAEFMDYLASRDRGDGRLQSPDVVAGETQRHFRAWFLNQRLSVKADWTSTTSDLAAVANNVTLYAGWSTPRYTTRYALNGGTWQDGGDSKIEYSLVVADLPWGGDKTGTATVSFAYPHQTDNSNADLYWYAQTADDDHLYIDQMYVVPGGVGKFMEKDSASGHWALKESFDIADLQAASEEPELESLTGRYFCYMAGNGTETHQSHEYYVNINRYLGDELAEPNKPIRNGYSFAGWYEFDQDERFDPDSTASQSTTRQYLADELEGSSVSIDAYSDGYVYLNSVGDAYLLHRDQEGKLFYYPDQTGYRLSFQHGASVVTGARDVYAAWEPSAGAEFHTLHLVEKSAVVDDNASFADYDLDNADTITLNIDGKPAEYYVLKNESQQVYNGSVVKATAFERLVDNESHVWLPQHASLNVSTTDATQTATVDANGTVSLQNDTGSYRVKDDGGQFSYYAYFVYKKTDQITYNVYAIDLSLAVAKGDLATYDDVFDRDDPPASDASYVLGVERRSMQLEGDKDPVVTVQAPDVPGKTVYRDTQQTLALAADEGSNNVYFYYVAGDGSNRYTITYHLMHDGSYETGWQVAFKNVPAADGETLGATQLEHFFDTLVDTAYAADGYRDSTESGEQSLYNRYKDMSIEMARSDAQTESFTVGGQQRNERARAQRCPRL